MKRITWRAKPVEDVYDEYAGEYLFRSSEYVRGSLVYDGERPVIVGDVVDVADEYLHLEWWVYVQPETLEPE